MLHQIQEKSVKIAEQCKHVQLEHIYTEKTLPYITLVKDTLKKLSLYMSTDKEYDMIEEAIVKKKTMDIIPVNAKDVMQSIIQLENKKNETERGKTEKLLILYQHNLDLRVKQMENLLKSSA